VPQSAGANWSSALEAAIRLINWATVWLIGGMQSPLFERPVGRCCASTGSAVCGGMRSSSAASVPASRTAVTP
jgi:hypothetical protein